MPSHLGLRAARADSTLDVLRESSEPSRAVFTLAQTRLVSVLAAVGVTAAPAFPQQSSASAGPLSGGPASLQSMLESQTTASKALLQRSQEATRARISQAENLRSREQAFTAVAPPTPNGGAGVQTPKCKGAGRGGGRSDKGKRKQFFWGPQANQSHGRRAKW